MNRSAYAANNGRFDRNVKENSDSRGSKSSIEDASMRSKRRKKSATFNSHQPTSPDLPSWQRITRNSTQLPKEEEEEENHSFFNRELSKLIELPSSLTLRHYTKHRDNIEDLPSNNNSIN